MACCTRSLGPLRMNKVDLCNHLTYLSTNIRSNLLKYHIMNCFKYFYRATWCRWSLNVVYTRGWTQRPLLTFSSSAKHQVKVRNWTSETSQHGLDQIFVLMFVVPRWCIFLRHILLTLVSPSGWYFYFYCYTFNENVPKYSWSPEEEPNWFWLSLVFCSSTNIRSNV